MTPALRNRPLQDSLNLRLTPELRERLLAAVPLTPGAASASGVARKAIDHYLANVLSLTGKA
jgi:hypothetical protein